MGYIEPVSLPSAAGVNFGEGDVRHFSEGDSVSVPGISNPTRHLAARDNLIAEKLNLAIAEINNKEQIIPLPVYRMVVPPSTEEIVANHRIPNGYEARVLNAAIGSTPNSPDIELNVMWAEGFGNVAGSSVMTTTSESSGGTTFSPAGEFIIQVKNKGGVTLDVVASVMITMRPITDVSGALLPAATVTPAGPTGAKGEKGDKGDGGSVGPAGSPGLNYRGAWVRLPFPITYQPNDVVYHDFSGTSRNSSFVCIQGHVANGVNEPQPALTPSPFWDWLSESGEVGEAGAGASSSTAVQNLSCLGTLASDFVGLPTYLDYIGGGVPGSFFTYTAVETTVTTSGGVQTSIVGSLQLAGYGRFTIDLPNVSENGASRNWSVSEVVVSAGTNAYYAVDATTIGVVVPKPAWIAVSFAGLYAT